MATTDVEKRPKQPATDVKAQEPPRKRRRRTAATGATDDCFTCQKRQAPCDRKRPYCSQCLEVGNECSGYKTTLTWGVGVASRGKLRGLSTPVAKTAEDKDGQNVVKKEPARKNSIQHNRRQSTDQNARNAANSLLSFQQAKPTTQPTPTPRTMPVKIEDGNNTGSNSMPFNPHIQWATPDYPSTSQHMSNALQNGLPALQTNFNQSNTHHRASISSAKSPRTYTDATFMTPNEYPQTPSSSAFTLTDQYSPFTFTGQQNYPQPLSALQQQQPNSYDNQNNKNLQSQNLIAHELYSTQQMFVPNDDQYNSISNSDDVYGDFDSNFNTDLLAQGSDLELDLGLSSDMTLSIPRSLYNNPFFQLNPRMQYLMDFYDKHICSVLVAFDGDKNPYRAHILQLALQNEGLQNAIAALATNNIRMRSHRQLKASGYVEELSEDQNADSQAHSRASVPPPTPEELCYKAISIDQLNMQLAIQSSAQDDSVLATLLILCLFHVCDSGFSKFKTQLAGVQKLLSLRGANAQNGFLSWVQMFFTWFDVMTSTVNDRETQIRGDSLDMLDYSTDLGALEQFSGCDGRLFKLIARLGRLNLLAQDRPVRADDRSTQSTPSASSFGGFPMPPTPRSFNPADFHRLDGNGWGTIIEEADENGSDESNHSNSPPNSWPPVNFHPRDGRHEFWNEWQDIRTRLQQWSMDASTAPSPTPITSDSSSSLEQRDMVHINECFRSSALLYTERLAYPQLPSSAANFQTLVEGALTHIIALSITSCVNKFLLWPLFIIGTECVDSAHRATVRQRCVEIQRESGFFNNLSVLEVLEKVWSETGPGYGNDRVDEVEEVRRRRRDSSGEMGRRWGQAFRWRRAMDRVDGEYIVV